MRAPAAKVFVSGMQRWRTLPAQAAEEFVSGMRWWQPLSAPAAAQQMQRLRRWQFLPVPVIRYLCRECGSSSLCRHQKPKWSCRACNVCKVPHHEARGRWLRHCWECMKEDPTVCDHNWYIISCPQCKRGGLTSSTG